MGRQGSTLNRIGFISVLYFPPPEMVARGRFVPPPILQFPVMFIRVFIFPPEMATMESATSPEKLVY